MLTDEVFRSPRFFSMLGYDAADFKGRLGEWEFLLHHEDINEVANRRNDYISGKTNTHETKFRVRNKSGDFVWIRSRGKIVARDENGNPTRMVGTHTDITEIKQAESSLNEQTNLLRTLIDGLPDIVALQRGDHTIEFYNQAGYNFLDKSPDEVNGRKCFTLIGRDSVCEGCATSKALLTKRTEVAERYLPDKDIWLEARAIPVLDRNGEASQVVEVLRDVTERKLAEDALRLSEERYRALFEDSRDAVLVTSRDGRFIAVNQSFCDLFGYERAELDHLSMTRFYANPSDRKAFQQAIEKTGSIQDFPVELRKRDGDKIAALFTASVRYGQSGEILGYQGTIRDMTERRSLEKQLLQAQKLESIGALAGGIAHDFNNLLQVVLGYSDMMLFDKKASDPDFEGLHAIRQAGRDGADLAKRILAFSRRLEPNARPVNLNNEIKRIEKMLTRTVSKMIEIEMLLSDNLMTVNADPGQMEQILLNLAINAQHAMPDGGLLTIETSNIFLDEEYCRTHVEAAPGYYAVMRVSDTGQGIEKDVVHRIFEPFFSTKGPGQGTGLGLSMVYGIVKSHKGHITCYSEPGYGTTFKIYLPAIVHEIEPDAASTRQMPAFGAETILLVDDEDLVRNLGEKILAARGYTVLTAANGIEALEVYRSNQGKIDLVILDLMMPQMGGRQCLGELLKIDPKVIVVIASGYSVKGRARDDIAAQAKGFITKPYDTREILGVVRDVLDER
jgi:PAS domain S-box-containing protein